MIVRCDLDQHGSDKLKASADASWTNMALALQPCQCVGEVQGIRGRISTRVRLDKGPT